MGSGDRFSITWVRNSIGVGLFVGRFPHAISIDICLLKIQIYIGFGKGYDE